MQGFLGITRIVVVIALAAALTPAAAQSQAPATAKATFAGGCFWCMESDFDKVPGVISTTSGYTGGTTVNPTYTEVGSGGTGHAESVEVVYDPAKVTYEQLLDAFWHNIDPLVRDRQFCDIGNEYRTAIFVHDEEQRMLWPALELQFERAAADPAVRADEARLQEVLRLRKENFDTHGTADTRDARQLVPGRSWAASDGVLTATLQYWIASCAMPIWFDEEKPSSVGFDGNCCCTAR